MPCERLGGAGVRRPQDLVGCAQSEEQMAATVTTARRIGFECDSAEPQRHAGGEPDRLAYGAVAALRA